MFKSGSGCGTVTAIPNCGGAGRAAGPGLATAAFIKTDRGGMLFIDSTRAQGAIMVAATARERTLACRFSFPWPGIRWTRWRLGTSRCGTRRGCWRTLIPRRCPAAAPGAG